MTNGASVRMPTTEAQAATMIGQVYRLIQGLLFLREDRLSSEVGGTPPAASRACRDLGFQGQYDDGEKPTADGAAGCSAWKMSVNTRGDERHEISFGQYANECVPVDNG